MNPEWVAPTSCLTYEPGIAYTTVGGMNGTTFIAPPELAPIRTIDNKPHETITEWTAAAPWADGKALLLRGHPIALINDTDAPVAMKTPSGTWATTDGTKAKASITLQPFSGIILIGTTPIAGPRYVLASAKREAKR